MDNQKLKKPTKTISGVAPISLMPTPRRCDHGVCLYCPTLKAPQSYTPESPAVLRARAASYDPKEQIKIRLETFKRMGHSTDKVEIIILGGTFPQYTSEYKESFIKACYDALNGVVASDLEEAKRINETTSHRCVALCIETRPDNCTESDIKDFLRWGATRVELGVQAPDDMIYKKINRCHTVADVVSATDRLKRAGFKVGYHMMPGMPYSSPDHDLEMFEGLFSSEKFQPDQVKIYPCQVLKGANLTELYYEGEFVPYNKQQTKDIIINSMKATPRYCRIMRIMREIPPQYLVAGVKHIDMRKDIEEEIRNRNIQINEIRFREIGFALRDKRKVDPEVSLKVTEYKASGGTEYFIEAVNKDDILFGLLRLRLDDDKSIPAMVRELHVYGPTVPIGEKAVDEWQHKGLGKELMSKAEEIAKGDNRMLIKVISGIGVREYYKKLGYNVDKENIYVEKRLA